MDDAIEAEQQQLEDDQQPKSCCKGRKRKTQPSDPDKPKPKRQRKYKKTDDKQTLLTTLMQQPKELKKVEIKADPEQQPTTQKEKKEEQQPKKGPWWKVMDNAWPQEQPQPQPHTTHSDYYDGEVHDVKCNIPVRGLTECSCWGESSMVEYKENLRIGTVPRTSVYKKKPATSQLPQTIDNEYDADVVSFAVTKSPQKPAVKFTSWTDPTYWFPAVFADCPPILKQGAHVKVCPEPGSRILHFMLANGRMGIDVPLLDRRPTCTEVSTPLYAQHFYCPTHDRYEQQHLQKSMPLTPIVWRKCLLR